MLQAVAETGDITVLPPRVRTINPLVLLCDLHNAMTESQDKTKWKRGLPTVVVKPEFLALKGPPCKGEGVDRATYPKQFEQHLDDPGFKAFLVEQQNKKGCNLSKCYKRVMGV